MIDASTIAANIDTRTVAGHNLRALLLRLFDGDRFRSTDEPRIAVIPLIDAAASLGLVEAASVSLTPLGREVAERLRPRPWRADQVGRSVAVIRPNGSALELAEGPTGMSDADRIFGEAERIAALLTADDLRAAKTYKSEPNT